jgi:hypothetical protein
MSAKYLTNGHTPSMILSPGESVRLHACETIVEKGLQTFVEVGNALLEIREARLYRQDFATFEDYCRERWEMSYRRSKQLMDAATVVSNLNNCSDCLPTHESQIRPLAKLEPEQQREAWQTATRLSPKPTAELITKIVEKAVADAAAKHDKSIHGGIASILEDLPQTDDQPKVRRTKNFDNWLNLVGAIDELNEIENFDPDLIATEEFEQFVKERLATGPRAVERIHQYPAALERRFPNVHR